MNDPMDRVGSYNEGSGVISDVSTLFRGHFRYFSWRILPVHSTDVGAVGKRKKPEKAAVEQLAENRGGNFVSRITQPRFALSKEEALSTKMFLLMDLL